MKYLRNFKILVAFICLYLAHLASGATQGWTQQRHNNTAWNPRFQPAQVAAPYQQANYFKPNGTRINSYNNWQRGNATYHQPQGERVWLNNNQSHPYIQVPGFRNPSNNIFAAAKQPNRSISEGAAWRQPNSWGKQNHNATQWFPAARSSNNFTHGTQFQSSSAGWAAPVNPAVTNGNRGANAGAPPNQWDNNAAGNARLPGSALVAGVYAGDGSAPVAPFGGSAFNGQQVWNSPNNPSAYGGVNGGYNSGAQLTPLAGHANRSQSEQPPSRGPYNTNPYANLFA